MTNGSSVPARDSDPETSWEAALSINVPHLESIVYKAVHGAGAKGLIAEDICRITGLAIQTCTPRVRPLLNKKLLIDTGYTRPAQDSNRSQRIVIAAPFLEAWQADHPE
jgi:hypothetical protein|tara:strand:+ start:71 stop:397 length:327 start_codon:yes stop_codon:yes gene_type:complete